MSSVHITARLSSRCYHSNEYVRGRIEFNHQQANKADHPIGTNVSLSLTIQSKLTFPYGLSSTLEKNASEVSVDKHSSCIFESESQQHHVNVSHKKTSTLSFAIALPEACCPSFRFKVARVVYMLVGEVDTTPTKTSIYLPFEVYGSMTYTFTMFPAIDMESESPKLFIDSENESSVGVRKGTEMPFEVGSLNPRRDSVERVCVYVIKKEAEVVVECSISKPFYHLGESILCLLNFTRSEIKCKRLVAILLRQEKSDSVVDSKVIASFAEETASTLQTSFHFPIPKQAIPTLQTNYISIQWLIQFNFLIDQPTESCQTLQWQIPIIIKFPEPSIQTMLPHSNIPKRYFTGSQRELVVEPTKFTVSLA
uniref:Uncharacterized protein AlNc14C380G11211 n=1 Tax=Albugo laibachii Nc14 TaxID=890382 RepID=F0WYF0_9STRA|nr:conserved hypothetical protein [Albugo laibachii Nc14]|eukprot:CCA26504.1 conserved hypothetical protein [Albugo laibachii Nc14]